MAIKISGTTIIDDSRNISNAGIVTASAVNTTGIVTASSFVGDGSGLTGLSIPASSDWRDNSLF